MLPKPVPVQRLRRRLMILLAGLLPALLILSVWANEVGLDLKQATRLAQQLYGGQVVKAEQTEIDQQPVYHIRMVREGRVRDVWIDARNGQIVQR
ncbi:PepSY domain-containing protein [Nitrincola tapanii]|uniref:PepSY domain-containing protein n=1 Tax=Nitrincola tapanii TaxID=1708751 RepID=A0A5A9W1C1_9GAMM|nr:PepSY domain-containing protein [Nitrincola tapanii]KAA0874372.1 hypothetical protein E1H14_08865 [Nitrincola tapanii]